MTNSSIVGSTFFGIDLSNLAVQLSSWSRRLSKRVLLLEFGNNCLRLSETSITPNGIQLNHISRVELPAEAFERGVPADPIKMAALLQEICREKKIRAHRAAVVLPPEVGYQRIINLPASLSIQEAREYVQDSKNGIQIPFPLDQTDFDLSPMVFPGITDQDTDLSPYMLTAIPQVLLDRIVEMLQNSDFELQLLELGNFSQLRGMAMDLTVLPPNQVDLVLELLPNSSNLWFVGCSGLLSFEKLSSIRDFPDPDLDDEQVITALDSGLSAESFIVNDEAYLPLSELDLRVLMHELKRALSRFNELSQKCEIRCLQLVGINSAHPLLVNLLRDGLGFSVYLHRPLLSVGVSGFSLDDVLVQAGLGRLVGLGLGLLSREQLLSCPLSLPKVQDTASNEQLAVKNAQLIDQKYENKGKTISSSLPLVSVALEEKNNSNASSSVSIPSQGRDSYIQQIEVVDVTDDTSPLFQFQVANDKPSVGAESVKDEEVVSKSDEENEWPSIGAESVKDEEVVSKSDEENEWPSIGAESVKDEEVVSKSDEENEWPSIGAESVKDEEVVSKSDEDSMNCEKNNLYNELQSESDDTLLSIPGLNNSSKVQLSQPKKSPLIRPDISDQESVSFGELRFADQADVE